MMTKSNVGLVMTILQKDSDMHDPWLSQALNALNPTTSLRTKVRKLPVLHPQLDAFSTEALADELPYTGIQGL